MPCLRPLSPGPTKTQRVAGTDPSRQHGIRLTGETYTRKSDTARAGAINGVQRGRRTFSGRGPRGWSPPLRVVRRVPSDAL